MAEAGVNHNGDINLAKQLIDAAHLAGADAVKFQTWKPGEITGKFATKVQYLQKTSKTDETRYELSNRLCLSYSSFKELQDYATQVGILFLSTADGFESLDFLVDELHIPIVKVGSTEVTHLQYLASVAKKQKPVILSTGLSTLAEINTAVATLKKNSCKSLTLLQCTSEYPAPAEEMNLKVIQTLASTFQVPVGLSDHSQGTEAAVAAVGMGATVIEKHFTIDKNLPGPDHQASVDVGELSYLIKAIRKVELMLGTGEKKPTQAEINNMDGIRRSVVAKLAIKSGATLTNAMLTCKRPGYGVQPAALDQLVGLRLNQDVEMDQPITWDMLET